MTRTRRTARPALMSASFVAMAVAAGGAQANPAGVFFERTLMSEAHARCGLFTPELAAALNAAAAQARGAALRSGVGEDQLSQTSRAARQRALSAGCGSADIALAADRVRSAFEGYARLQRMTYPGEQAAWRADRIPSETARWRLAQDARFGRDRMTFGLAGREAPGVLLAVAEFADGAKPYGARLVFRDTRRTLGPYLAEPGSKRAVLARRLAPREASRVYLAEARSIAGRDLLPAETKGGWAFRFPPDAVGELARLDPREAVAVEFLLPRESVRTAFVEVGDFAAGSAFVKLAAR